MKLITSILLVLFMIQLNVGFKLEKAERFKLERSISLELNQDDLNGDLNANQKVNTSTEHNLDYNHGFKDKLCKFLCQKNQSSEYCKCQKKDDQPKSQVTQQKMFHINGQLPPGQQQEVLLFKKPGFGYKRNNLLGKQRGNSFGEQQLSEPNAQKIVHLSADVSTAGRSHHGSKIIRFDKIRSRLCRYLCAKLDHNKSCNCGVK